MNPSLKTETGNATGSPGPCTFLFKPLQLLLQYLSARPALLFGIWALWLAAECFVFGPNSYVRIHDNGDGHLPARLAFASSIHHGEVGFWVSQWVTGTDRFAQAVTNDLTVLPFLILPGWIAYALVLVLQRFIAGYFTFRLLREETGITNGAAIYAGLFFALFAQNALNRDWAGFTLYSGFALPGIPLVLLALSRLERYRRLGPLLAACIGVVFALSGGIIMTFFMFLLGAFWFAFVSPRRTRFFWILFACFTVAWSIAAFVALLPTLTNGPLSNRGAFNPDVVWGLLSKIIETGSLLKDNLAPLVFGLLGLAATTWHERRLRAIAVAVCFCLAAAAFSHSVTFHLRHVLGFLYAFNWERFSFLVPFLSSAAAAIGLSQLRSWRIEFATGSSLYKISAAGMAIGLGIVLLVVQSVQVKRRTLSEILDGSNFRALYLNPTLQELAAQNSAEPHSFRVATISLGTTDPPWPPDAAWAYGFDTADGYLNLQFLRYRDFWEQILNPLTKADRAIYAWVHSWGCQFYLFAPTKGFPRLDATTTAPVKFSDYYRLSLLTLANVRYIVSPIPLVDSDLTLLPSPVREQQIAWSSRSHLRRIVDMLLQRAPGSALYVYENKQRLRQAFCAHSVRGYDDRKQLLMALASATPSELATTAMFERDDVQGVSIDTDGQDGRVAGPRYLRDAVELDVDTDSGCPVVLTDSYSPYWKAQLDGVATRLLPVDAAFQAVMVPAGHHRVFLSYRPPYALGH